MDVGRVCVKSKGYFILGGRQMGRGRFNKRQLFLRMIKFLLW